MPKADRINFMNQSFQKTLLYSALALTGGFAVLGFLQKDSWWPAWLAGFCLLLAIYFVLYHPKKKDEKQKEIESILPESAKAALQQGEIPLMRSELKLKPNEKLLWLDQMRTDYYNSKPRVFYLTTSRLVCLDEDFRFSHPVDQMEITFSKGNVRVKAGKSKMAFLCASPESLQQAWTMAAGQKRS